MPAAIVFDSVSKHYGRHHALREVSFSVEAGEVFGLLGPNGAGKTTTLNLLCGLTCPSSGQINLFGKDLRRHHLDLARRMGVLVERPAIFDYLTVRRNLSVQARLAGAKINLDRVLDLVGLLHQGERLAGRLSAGMRQRLGLAQALLAEPELLLLDEPCTALDPEATRETLTLLRRLATEARVTIVFSSHRLDEVEQLCDRVAVLNEGRLVSCDETGELISYDQAYVEVLMEGAEAAAKKVAAQPWAKKVETRHGRLLVEMQGAGAHQLNVFLINAGYQVSGLLPRRRTLRDYFEKVMRS